MSDVGGEQVQVELVQVREGRWETRNGDIRNVTPTPAGDGREHRFPWWDAQYRQTWGEDGRYHVRGESPLDLFKYIGPIEPQPQPQPQPEPEKLPEGCRNDGGWSSGVSGTEPEPWPEPQPEPQPPVPQDADQMIRLLSEANHNHVAMIGRLQGRINDLETINAATTAAFDRANKANDTNVETIGKMQRELQQQHRELQKREVRIFDLDTINTAQEKALDAANKENTDLQHRLNVVAAEWAEQTERFRRLQLANNKLAQLEVLQPIAAACHTAQTMVRDMLGHMRCLLALQHTTDRSNFCALLESILEVFDEAECDEDEDDDTTCTSEAGQG